MSQQIIVNISADGAVTVEAQGVRGAGCQQLTANLEKALGERTGDTKKSEFFQATQTQQGAQQSAK